MRCSTESTELDSPSEELKNSPCSPFLNELSALVDQHCKHSTCYCVQSMGQCILMRPILVELLENLDKSSDHISPILNI